MPNIKSAIKKVRGDKTKTEQNDTYRTRISKGMKLIRKAKTDDEKTKQRNEVISLIDKSAKRKIVAKNKASRMKRKAYKLH
jgi:small subunit ribosomal protein S20